MRLMITSLGKGSASVVIPLIKFTLAGESNAFSQNDVTDQDFVYPGLQYDLPQDGAIPNATYFSGSAGQVNVWMDFELDINYSPNTPAWGTEYRIGKQILENDKRADTLEQIKYSKGGSRIGQGGEWNIVDGALQNGIKLVHGWAGNFRPDFYIWIQGLNDATSDSLAAEYEENLRGWAADTMTHINPKYIVISRASTLTVPDYSHRIPTIQAAQDQVSSESSRYILHTPDPTLELNADGIHYSPDGMDNLGRGIYNTIKPYISTLNDIP